jgi:hypothetical protein
MDSGTFEGIPSIKKKCHDTMSFSGTFEGIPSKTKNDTLGFSNIVKV